MADHFRQQRVERRAGFVTDIAEAVGAHAGARGRLVGRQPAAGRAHCAVLAQRLHVDARLNRVAARLRQRVAGQPQLGQRRPARHAQLRLHQVNARHLLGDGVLHLQPRVGLQERERRVAIPSRPIRGVDQKLERAQRGVAGGAADIQRRADDPLAQRGIQMRRGRDFDDLLEAPLHAALALAEMRDVAAQIADDLHLDVARARNQLLHVERAVAERRFRLRTAAFPGRRDLLRVHHRPRAAPAAARDRLDHHRRARAQRIEKAARVVQCDRVVRA